MPRFITFVSTLAEADAHARAYPDVEHAFASFSALGHGVFVVDPAREEEFLGAVTKEHARAPFTGVLNRKEKCLGPAARLAQRLGLRPICDDPDRVRDKYAMRRALTGADPGPRTLLLRTEGDVATVPADRFPGVFKPRFGFNSRAVVRVDSAAGLLAAWRRLQPPYAALPKQDGTPADFVLEDLIPGTEHTLDVLVEDGHPVCFLVSDKDAMTPPHYVEVGDRAPSRLDDAGQQAVRAAATQALTRAGVRNGWSHVEVRLAGGRAWPIEVAARMGGGYFEPLSQRAWGVDRMRALIDLHLGRPLGEAKALRHVVGRRLLVDGVRWIVLRRGKAALTQPGVHLIWPTRLARVRRWLVGPPYDFNNTVLEYLAEAPTPAAADALASAVAQAAQPFSLPLPAALRHLRRRHRPS